MVRGAPDYHFKLCLAGSFMSSFSEHSSLYSSRPTAFLNTPMLSFARTITYSPYTLHILLLSHSQLQPPLLQRAHHCHH